MVPTANDNTRRIEKTAGVIENTDKNALYDTMTGIRRRESKQRAPVRILCANEVQNQSKAGTSTGRNRECFLSLVGCCRLACSTKFPS